MQVIDIINQLLKGSAFCNLTYCLLVQALLQIQTHLGTKIFCCGVNTNVLFSSNDFTRNIYDVRCTLSPP